MYVMLAGLLSVFAASTGVSGSFGGFNADSGLAMGRPANGLLMGCVCGGMIGMLLLESSAGLSSGACSCLTTISVSALLKLANLDGGGGRDPDGRDVRCVRRSERYDAVISIGQPSLIIAVRSAGRNGLGRFADERDM